MKKVILYFLVLSLVQNHSFSNGWSSLRNGFNEYVQTIYIDSSQNKIYAGGAFHLSDSLRVNGIAVWDGIKWDSLGPGMTHWQSNLAITKYQNEIYTGGTVTLNTSVFGGKFNDITDTWDSLQYGLDGPIYQFKEINGLLWVSGLYYNMNGDSCNMLGTWDGANWNCFDLPYYNNIQDFIYYNGNLVFGGNFFDTLTHENVDLAMFDGSNLSYLGHPIYGGLSEVTSIVLFQGDLYVAGYFSTSSGNEGNNIMRWDGSQWHDVGGGTDSEIWSLEVYNNELYAGGIFEYAGGIHTGNLAKWNGIQWSKVSSAIISPGILDMEFYNGELYIAGGFTHIDTLEVNRIAKFSGIGSDILENELINISLYPNPATTKVEVSNNKKITQLTMTDLLGRVIYSRSIKDYKTVIDVSDFSKGVYLINVFTDDYVSSRKLIVE
jgi:hypothetical protein